MLDSGASTLCDLPDGFPRLFALFGQDTLEDVQDDLVGPIANAVDILYRA